VVHLHWRSLQRKSPTTIAQLILVPLNVPYQIGFFYSLLLPFTPLLAECRFDYSYYAEYRHLFQVKTRSGKGNAPAQKVSVSVSETFEIEEVIRTKKPKPENLEPAPSSDPDKLMQTTFRLGLKISEKEAKSQVKL
jgi:hypothetical protein